VLVLHDMLDGRQRPRFSATSGRPIPSPAPPRGGGQGQQLPGPVAVDAMQVKNTIIDIRAALRPWPHRLSCRPCATSNAHQSVNRLQFRPDEFRQYPRLRGRLRGCAKPASPCSPHRMTSAPPHQYLVDPPDIQNLLEGEFSQAISAASPPSCLLFNIVQPQVGILLEGLGN
jgi:hypothetical protein